MKLFNSHIYKASKLQNFGIPLCPKVVIFGSPNIDVKLFAHRLAIDAGVPAISIKQIYNTILTFEDKFSNETFYRKLIKILKNEDKKEANLELESNLIPEKLLTLSKYSENGFILYDYPNNIYQAKSLEAFTNGGINLAINLMFKKDIALEREEIKHQCLNCGRNYYKGLISHTDEGCYIKGNFPKEGVCEDCGSHNIKNVSDKSLFEKKYSDYENKLTELGQFYNKLGLLLNFEIKNGLDDYTDLKNQIHNNIKH